ncbi:MAG TPA: polysaccharide biosynthesis/export family protein [Tepidisphaeraceae bacterium]|nr:polysaccharide biosynthesis/export family protein [Tepidisphaeraceae bacterium]
MRRVESGKIRTVLMAAVLAAMGGVVGCTGKDEPNGFLDPTSVGRWDDKRPLVVPILSHLDVGMEESNSAFQSATEVRPEDLVAHPEDYLISPDDLLTITVSDLVGPGADQVSSRRVTETGRVSLPMLGQIPAAGRSESDLEKEIQQAYKTAGLIQNAQVSVTVTEARGRTFSITGDGATRAGQYPMYKGDFRILDALVAMGGVTPNSDTIYVIRNTAPKKPATMPAAMGDNSTMTAPGQALEPAANPGASLEPAAPAPAQTAKPAAPPPAPPTSAPAEGRIVIIDGKPVVVGEGQTQPVAKKTVDAGAPAASGDAKMAAPMAQKPMQPMPMTGKEMGGMAATEPGGELKPETSDDKFEFDRLVKENQRIIRVNLKALWQGDMKYNIVVQPGDTLVVPGPVIGEYYMAGHVTATGVYSLSGREITLKQAVVSAHMFDQIAIPRRTEIVRRLGPDREVVVGVDLDSIFAGTQPDIYLKPNDIVNVGTNAWAPFLAAFRGAFRITYGFGFLYDRNYASKANNEGLSGR